MRDDHHDARPAPQLGPADLLSAALSTAAVEAGVLARLLRQCELRLLRLREALSRADLARRRLDAGAAPTEEADPHG